MREFTFTCGAAQLRNPLHAMQGAVTQLTSGTLDADATAVELDSIGRGLAVMVEVTNDVLDAEALRAGALRACVPVCLCNVCTLHPYLRIGIACLNVSEVLRPNGDLHNPHARTQAACASRRRRRTYAPSSPRPPRRAGAMWPSRSTSRRRCLRRWTSTPCACARWARVAQLCVGWFAVVGCVGGCLYECVPFNNVSRARQILINAVTNAVKYTPTGSPEPITMAAHLDATASRLVIEVTDCGRGLRGQTLKQLLVEFAGNGALSPRAGAIRSSGLGIPICARLAGLMGGRIGLIDRSDGISGARFTLTLPLDPRSDAMSFGSLSPVVPGRTIGISMAGGRRTSGDTVGMMSGEHPLATGSERVAGSDERTGDTVGVMSGEQPLATGSERVAGSDERTGAGIASAPQSRDTIVVAATAPPRPLASPSGVPAAAAAAAAAAASGSSFVPWW